MNLIKIKKYALALFFIGYFFLPNRSSAIGITTGPSLGIATFYTSFEARDPSQKIDTKNLALQLGWFAKLDLWLVYAKLDTCFVLDCHKLPNQFNKAHFQYIKVPLTIGMPFFNFLRPHIGLIFRIPLGGSDDIKFNRDSLIENYSKKINGYVFGIGIDLANLLIDICWEVACSTIDKRSISSGLLYNLQKHRPKQLSVKLSYNLLL